MGSTLQRKMRRWDRYHLDPLRHLPECSPRAPSQQPIPIASEAYDSNRAGSCFSRAIHGQNLLQAGSKHLRLNHRERLLDHGHGLVRRRILQKKPSQKPAGRPHAEGGCQWKASYPRAQGAQWAGNEARYEHDRAEISHGSRRQLNGNRPRERFRDDNVRFSGRQSAKHPIRELCIAQREIRGITYGHGLHVSRQRPDKRLEQRSSSIHPG
jgi:hypothetical protein